MHIHKQQGAALITALFIMAITAILATAMALSLHLLIYNTDLVQNSDRAHLDLQGVEFWARAQILQFHKQLALLSSQNKPHFLTHFGPRQFENATVSGVIEDEQGRYNINNLGQKANAQGFVVLLKTVIPDLTTSQAMQLTYNIYNKFQKTPVINGRHIGFTLPGELSEVPGFNGVINQKLQPYITALPVVGTQVLPININTVSAPVLMTLLPGKLTLPQAQQVINCVKLHGRFYNKGNFTNQCVKRLGLPSITDITTSSLYYKLRAQASIGWAQDLRTHLIEVVQGNKHQLETRLVY